ncbi:MAG: hypothetical protein WC236_10185 [Gallionellaceae bacterium]|jgi:hypothetical protein
MTCLKRLLLGEILLLLIAGPAIAADDVTTQALKLYEKNRYEDAAQLLRPELASMDAGRQPAASLALGMTYLRSAALYRGLHQTALVIELDYLTQLSRQRTGAASRHVDFYLGQALLEAGRTAEGATYLRRFAGRAGLKGPAKAYADIELGVAYSRQKQAQKATRAWSGLDLNNPSIKAALAGAYAAAGAHQHKPLLMADEALARAKAQRLVPDARMIRNLLRVYSQAAAPEQALALLDANELKGASFSEELGASKAINFYDPSLLHDIARTHLHAAVFYLEQAGRDTRLGATASFYLADAYMQQGNEKLALHALDNFLTQAKLPVQYRNNAQIQQAVALGRVGQKKESKAIWQALAAKSANDPDLLAALLQACTPAQADCATTEKLALAAVEKGEGKKFFLLNAALGKYYLLQKSYPRAELYMEAGRDKANKNKIEVNDPVMLVALAEAYYRNKKFSENLEIYFEIGKQYPAVRQIQEAMQGIYSMEQQSAGDVKIF